jgi:hypothetical protein
MFTALFLKIDRSRYENADALVNFDPINDLLLNEQSYLTWREWGQQLPGDSEPIALMTNPENFLLRPGWMDEEFDWMGRVMQRRFDDLTNTKWQPTNYRGMLSRPQDMLGIESRLTAFNALVASSPLAVKTVLFPVQESMNSQSPKLAFCDDGQIDSLCRHPNQTPKVTWSRVFPALVVNLRAHQRLQLKSTT